MSLSRARVKTAAALLLLICGQLTACGSDDNQRLRVDTQASPGGQIIPARLHLFRDQIGKFQVSPEPGFQIVRVEGCEGELVQQTYVIDGLSTDCTLRAEFARKHYRIETQAEGGQISPQYVSVRHGDTARFELSPDTGFRLTGTEVSGCRGQREQNIYTTDELTGACELQVRFGRQEYSLSGRIASAAGTRVDTTLNDRASLLLDNNSPDKAQLIPSLVTVQGFAVFNESSPGTGGDPEFEHFANANDEDDFFTATLQAGQRVRLTIADQGLEAPEAKDLDLIVLTDDLEFVASSTSQSGTEEVVIPEDGDYILNVWAAAGEARYLLQLLAPGQAQANATLDWVPEEIIAKTAAGTRDTKAARNSAIDPALLKHPKARRLKLPEPAPKKQLGLAIPGATMFAKTGDGLEPLRRSNPDSYRKIRTLREAKALAQQPGVDYAEPNYIVKSANTPSDPLYAHQWHYPSIDLPQAWDLLGNVGANDPVTVAVIDTGVYLDHPDLKGQWVPGYDFVADPEMAGDGDGIDSNPDDPGDSTTPGDSSWHGTHVAGIIAALNDNDQGIAGIATDASLMPIRTLGMGGQGTTYDLVQGLLYAAGLDNDSGQIPEHRADIVNLSLGSPAYSQLAEEAFRKAREAGVILVAAAGNSGTNTAFYPAAYDSVLSVGATDARQQRAPYSNYGPTVSLVAPGGNNSQDADANGHPDGILSTLAFKNADQSREPRYGYYNGTSMAAPHVAGTLALMKSIYPSLTPVDVGSLLANSALTDDLGEDGRDDVFGYGQINALKAVQTAVRAQDNGGTPTWPPLLEARPASLTFRSTSEAQIELVNQGGGEPAVTDVRTDPNWLSASSYDTNSQGLGFYRISVDWAQADQGYSTGRIIFTLDQGDQVTVPVYLQGASSTNAEPMPPLYLLLLNTEGRTIAHTRPQTHSGEAVYQLDGIPPGEYYLYAGSDMDMDQVICQVAESCGAYPLLERPEPVKVDKDRNGLNFITRPVGGSISSSLGPSPWPSNSQPTRLKRSRTKRNLDSPR